MEYNINGALQDVGNRAALREDDYAARKNLWFLVLHHLYPGVPFRKWADHVSLCSLVLWIRYSSGVPYSVFFTLQIRPETFNIAVLTSI